MIAEALHSFSFSYPLGVTFSNSAFFTPSKKIKNLCIGSLYIFYLTFQIAFIKFLISLNIDKENFLTTTFLKGFIYLVANIYFYNFFAHQIIFNNVIKYKYVIKRLLLLMIITISIYWIIQDSFFLCLLNKIIQVIKP